MRILIANDLHSPMVNGVATSARTLAMGLADRGHEVVVVAPSQTGKKYEEIDVNHRIVRTASVIFPFYQNIHVSLSPNREINQLVKTFKPDVIHIHMPLGIGVGARAAAKKFKIPLVATNHAMSENLIDNFKLLAPFARQFDYILHQYGSRFYRACDYVVMPTDAALKMLKPETFSKPFITISNGIDLSRFQPGKAPADFYKRFKIPSNVPIIMYLGRLDAEKHASVLLRAVNRLVSTHKFHVVMVGFGNDLDHLKEVARDLDITDRVTFTGSIDEADKPTILKTGNIFVMPSPAELQSIATLEAMATGMSVVAVNAGALYELCQDGLNGFLFDLDDDAQAAGGIRKLLDDPKLQARMSAKSLAIAQTHNLTHVLEEFEGLYSKVIELRKADLKPKDKPKAKAK